MNLHDSVHKRISNRTYLDKKISSDDLLRIQDILLTHKDMNGPFGHSFNFILNINNSKDTNNKKIGTYGILKNVPAYIGGVCENNIESIVDFGYVFEHVILCLTSIGFGTCWLGGTFRRKDFLSDIQVGNIIPAISPIGYTALKRSFAEKIVRNTAKSDNRLPFNELFLDKDSKTLSANLDIKVVDCLEMVRKGPSASNKQPWRIIVDNDSKVYHFYIARTKNYASMLKYDIQALDIGISLAHFKIGLKHYDIDFTKEVLVDYPIIDEWKYIISLKQAK